MRTTTPLIKEKHVEVKLRNWLWQGKSITHNEAQKRWRTNRLAEYVRRLRRKGEKILTTMTTYDGDRFAVYSIPKRQKASKIKGLYKNQVI